MKSKFVVSISGHVDVTYYMPLRGAPPEEVLTQMLSDDPKAVAKRLKRRADYAISSIERYVHAAKDGEIQEEVPDHIFDRADELSVPGCLSNMPSSLVLTGNAMASKYLKFSATSLEDALRQFDLIAPADLDRAPWRIWGIELYEDVFANMHLAWTPNVTADDLEEIGYELDATLR